ncbi:MBL fold metallo-hydrolase [Candidatus Thorarchaeota archaeon]|nr:MAG: MBL fold metallo-hydrolase [Candidatus Thorarchaeota archaeon]
MQNDMELKKNLLVDVENEAVSKLLETGLKSATTAIEGDFEVHHSTIFNENPELLPFELLRKSEVETDCLPRARDVHENLLLTFRDEVDGQGTDEFLEAMNLCAFGVLVGNYTDEDFRYLYRYSLRKSMNTDEIHKHLQSLISMLAASHAKDEDSHLENIRHWLHFLGTPFFPASDFVAPSLQWGIDLNQKIASEEYRLVESLHKYPDYTDEAVRGRPFLEVYEAVKDWLPDGMLQQIHDTAKEEAYETVSDELDRQATISATHEKIRHLFENIGYQSHPDSTLPVRIQKLPNPPPAEEIDPVVFEMIPEKMRMNLLPAVAYAMDTKEIEIIFIGGPRIGHSGIVIKTNNGSILLDFGLSVANQRIPEWIPELDALDSILISHAHLDHIGGLPILFDSYEGKWCATGVTGAITKELLEDALKVGTPLPPRREDKRDLISKFTGKNVAKVTKNHVSLEKGKSVEVGPGIIATPVDACHIPGSVAYIIDIEGLRILYTGDFNLDKSVLFAGATLPSDCDYVIFDGTYWGREDFNRAAVAKLLSESIEKHGPVIIPSFAVGRSQEVLKILDEIGVTSKRNVMVAGLAERITKMVGLKGKWDGMKKNKVDLDKYDVLVAGGGMMGGGLARYHFKQHRNNPNAAVIPCGYLAPRTPGWNLVNGFEPHDCDVAYARLSAHSSSRNLTQYIDSCKGKPIIVHTPSTEIPKGIMMPDLRQRITIKI